MLQGICGLSAIPMRAEPADTSEMVNQVIFGEGYTVLEEQKKWLRISLIHDHYEGWIDRKQFTPCESSFWNDINHPIPICSELIEIVTRKNAGIYFPVFLGSSLPYLNAQEQTLRIYDHEYNYQGPSNVGVLEKSRLIDYAYQYLNAPYLWGGRTPFGIDCSGFVQMVYKICGYQLPRDASQQALQGYTLSFIEEAEPGDLAFFDNEEGKIIHVGLMLQDNYILHASGKVRLDRLDQTGIFNSELGTHTHKLRVIKKII